MSGNPKITLWLLTALSMIQVTAAAPSKDIANHPGSKQEAPALVDMETGLVFPERLAGFVFYYQHQYDEPGLGYGVRYQMDEWNKVDIYVYDLGYPEIPDGPDSEIVKKESRSVARIVRSMQENNSYANVKTGAKSLTPMGGQTSFIKQTYRYEELHNRSGQGPVKRQSESYLTGYKNHFVKIRFTYDSNKGLIAKQAIRELVDGLIDVMEAEHSEKTMALAAARIFQAAPTTDAARYSMQGALDYSIETDDFTIAIPVEIFPWMNQDEEIQNSELLFAGYLAGVLSHIIPNGLEEGGGEEGFSAMLNTYRALRDKGVIQKIDRLDAWLLEEDKKALFQSITDTASAG